jgi:hypothetical protein
MALLERIQVWRDRFRLDVGANLTGRSDIGNKVLIRNLGSRPVILANWSMYYQSGRWPFRRKTYFANPEYDFSDVTIEPQSTCELTFSDHDHFDWGASQGGESIYIRLYLVGRRDVPPPSVAG